MAKMGRPRRIESPQDLWQAFSNYSTSVKLENEKPFTMDGFYFYCKKNNICSDVYDYFRNKNQAYTDMTDICKSIKSKIYQHKLNLYKSGKLHYQQISKDLYDRGLKFDDINNGKFILKTIDKEFPFENCKEGITIKDSYLKKITPQAKNMVYKKPPNEIYVINIKGTNIFKVGVSCNAQRRIFDLRAANPFPIDVIHIQKSLFPSELERKIHNHLSDKHIKNEWFKVDDINSVLDIIKKG